MELQLVTGPYGPSETCNLKLALEHTQVLKQELRKECLASQILGPFSSRPIRNLKCSGLGAVPKKGGKWCIILHLSALLGKSINDHISKEDFSLHYASMDDTTHMLSALEKGAPMAKVDLKSAFRMVLVQRQDWKLFGMNWKGCRHMPSLWVKVSQHLTFSTSLPKPSNGSYNTTMSYSGLSTIWMTTSYVVSAPDSHSCGEHLQCFLRVCMLLGFPVAMDKVDSPATVLPFLGLELDSVSQQIHLPLDKLREILQELTKWQSHSKTTKGKLLSLIDKLTFAARAVPAGRLFIRRLITLSTKAKRLHHCIRLNSDAQADITWWQKFLPTWNGTAQFVDQQPIDAANLELYVTQTLLAHMDVVRTFKGSGFPTTGNHISSFQNMCLSNGKNSSQLSLQPSLGATLGGKGISDSTVTTS